MNFHTVGLPLLGLLYTVTNGEKIRLELSSSGFAFPSALLVCKRSKLGSNRQQGPLSLRGQWSQRLGRRFDEGQSCGVLIKERREHPIKHMQLLIVGSGSEVG